MSASREKKQRQDLLSQGPTQKQIREQKEAQARKRKTVIYTVIGVVIALAVVTLLVWHSGIFQRGVTAATVGDRNVSVAEMQYYYNYVRQSELYYQQMYSSYGISFLEDPYQAYDFTSEDGDAQVYNSETGQTYAEYFEESALDMLRQITALSDAAEAAGYQLSDDGKQQVEDSIDSLSTNATSNGYPNAASYLTALYGRYVTEGLYRDLLTEQMLATEYRDQHQDSLTYTDEDFEAYAAEHASEVTSYEFRYAYISGVASSTTDEDGNTVEPTEEDEAAALEEAKNKADAIVSGVQAAEGDKSDAFNELVLEQLGEDSTYADPDTNLRTEMGSNISSSVYYEWLSSSDRQPGDITSIESSGSGYWVVLFLGSGRNDDPTVDVRHILIKAELTEDDPDTEDVDESSDVPTDEQMEAAHTEAQRILDEFLAGDQTEESFAALAQEYSDDSGSSSNGGLYTYVEEGTMVQAFNDWIFDSARQSGDTGLVENTNDGQYGWHVMYFVGQNGPKWHEDAEAAMTDEDMSAWLEELEAPYETAAADGMSMVH